MEEKINEQTLYIAQSATAEEEKGVKSEEVSLGKFKDVGALLNAYNSLQAEFTKRCQKIKELEGKLDDKTIVPSTPQAEKVEKVDTKEEKEKAEVLKEYLLDVLGKKPSAVIMDGAGTSVKTPVNRPTTILEAGNLAKNLLNKN